jgi:hypothetical protein
MVIAQNLPLPVAVTTNTAKPFWNTKRPLSLEQLIKIFLASPPFISTEILHSPSINPAPHNIDHVAWEHGALLPSGIGFSVTGNLRVFDPARWLRR